MNVGKVDCTVEEKLCTRFNIQGYPTLKFYNRDDRKLYDYNGDRSLNSLIEFSEGGFTKAASNPIHLEKAAAPESPDVISDVVVLTDSNFDTLTKGGHWLLDFYAPWCGHCKRLAPTYEQLATQLKGKVNVAKIDCTVEREVASRFGINGYPTIKFLADGILYEYSGDRSVTDFVQFVTERYKAGNPQSIPEKGSGSGFLNDLAKTLSPFEQILSAKGWLILFFVLIFGILIGGIVLGSSDSPKKSE